MEAGRSEICRADQQLETLRRIHKAVWKLNSFLLGGPQSSLLRPSTSWTRPTHIIENNLLYSKCTDLNVNHTLNIPSQQHLAWCLIKQLDTIAWPSSHIKLTITLAIHDSLPTKRKTTKTAGASSPKKEAESEMKNLGKPSLGIIKDYREK